MKEMAPLAQAGLNEGYQTEIHDDFLIVVHVPTLGWLISVPQLDFFKKISFNLSKFPNPITLSPAY